jgi:S-adenosylmethionine:tRNA ribosyltransferase-isomerase
MRSAANSPLTFTLPEELMATAPPERRGLRRDGVKLLVLDRKTHATKHLLFRQLPDELRPGDLLVLNNSRTLPAVLVGFADSPSRQIELRLAEQLADGTWLVLLLCGSAALFDCGLRSGMTVRFGDDLTARVLEPDPKIPRLWHVDFSKTGSELIDTFYRLGSPIRYEYVSGPLRLDDYQTVYASAPGSSEMPSAGRAFTWELLLNLRRRGIKVVPLTLHTTLSSLMDDDLDRAHYPKEENFSISFETARSINETRAAQGRVIAVGTTVVRALESAAESNGPLSPRQGYTRLQIDRSHKLKIVDGLLTGLHEPYASHLDLLSAFVSPSVLKVAYEEALRRGYLWHEFGDLNLIL